MKKPTMATVKSFIKKRFAENDLYILQRSSFDGMTDCVQEVKDNYRLVKELNFDNRNTLGISGAWFVNQSRDYITIIENDEYVGYNIYNCCGNFNIVSKKWK